MTDQLLTCFRNRFKSFKVCMGYCENALESSEISSPKSPSGNKITESFQVPEPLLGPKPGSDEDGLDLGESDSDAPVYDDYDPERCKVLVL